VVIAGDYSTFDGTSSIISYGLKDFYVLFEDLTALETLEM
jgi:hypothetical protein